jgi:hypothetical protein
MENRISINVPDEVSKVFISKILEATEVIKPYIVTVSDADKGSILKLGDKKTPFVQKCLAYAETDPEYSPKYLDVEEFTRDTQALLKFNSVISSVEKMASPVEDTRSLLAHDAYASALVYYGAVKLAAKSGDAKAKVIYDDLSKWFSVNSTSSVPAAEKA